MNSIFILLLVFCLPAFADEPGIADNSFLIEEAYNQGSGEVQHIVTTSLDWIRVDDRKEFEAVYGFAQEWPIWGHAVQFAYEISKVDKDDDPGLGVQFRYQLKDDRSVALAPAISIDVEKDRDLHEDRYTFGALLPVSYRASEKWATHGNLGVSYSPYCSVYDELPGPKPSQVVYPDLTTFTYGASAIYALRNNLNLMLEVLVETERAVDSKYADLSESATAGVVSPGVRYAINFPSTSRFYGEKQLVLGIGVPIGITAESSDFGLIFYMSFEHLFKRTE